MEEIRKGSYRKNMYQVKYNQTDYNLYIQG